MYCLEYVCDYVCMYSITYCFIMYLNGISPLLDWLYHVYIMYVLMLWLCIYIYIIIHWTCTLVPPIE
jgi:hypothetical protein